VIVIGLLAAGVVTRLALASVRIVESIVLLHEHNTLIINNVKMIFFIILILECKDNNTFEYSKFIYNILIFMIILNCQLFFLYFNMFKFFRGFYVMGGVVTSAQYDRWRKYFGASRRN
jgi:hypothetical protein